jgi:hypothetical protein
MTGHPPIPDYPPSHIWTWDTCDRTAIPSTDDDTVYLINEAVKNLTIFRAGELGDAGATVSVLASLITEAEYQLNDAVAAARDQGYTWDQIGDRLQVSATTTRRRYRDYALWKNSQHPDD